MCFEAWKFYEILVRLECACSANYSVGSCRQKHTHFPFSLPSACSRVHRYTRMIENWRVHVYIYCSIANASHTNQWFDWVSLIINCVCALFARQATEKPDYVIIYYGRTLWQSSIKCEVNFCTWAKPTFFRRHCGAQVGAARQRHRSRYRAHTMTVHASSNLKRFHRRRLSSEIKMVINARCDQSYRRRDDGIPRFKGDGLLHHRHNRFSAPSYACMVSSVLPLN